MKIFLVSILALLAFFRASAQVSVEVTLEQDQFLSGEALPVAVKITNRSGQPLHLGADASWLTFSVESVDGFVVIKNAEVPVSGEFDLASSQLAIKRADLAPYFVISKPGRYHIIATLRIKDWSVEVSSSAKPFDVIAGAKLWEQEFGVPAATNGAPEMRKPEMRKYVLEQANYLQSQLRLYMQVSDATESRIYKVAALGPMVSFGQPEAQVDRFGNLHVLWQSGSSAFAYTVVNPTGEIARQEIYDYFTTRPRLAVNDAGETVVVGGVRRMKPVELPVVQAPNELPAPAHP
jgi:hypothetical protein